MGSYTKPKELVKTCVSTTQDSHAFGRDLRTEAERRAIKRAKYRRAEVRVHRDVARPFTGVDVPNPCALGKGARNAGRGAARRGDAAGGRSARWCDSGRTWLPARG